MGATRRTMLGFAAAGALLPGTARAELGVVRIGLQPGMTYLPFAVAQHEGMIERRAKAEGLDGLAVEWTRLAGGDVLNNALLAGQLDCAATGFPSFFVLWSKARGRLAIRGLMSYGNTPLLLLTRNPAVRSVADFSDGDRITVPAVNSSIQAIMLQVAADRQWGQPDRLDRLTVSRSHPDAVAALLSMSGEISSASSAPPYQYLAVDRPGIRAVTTSEDIFGGPSSNGLLYMTESFHDQNPAAVRAINGAMREALALVDAEPRRAAEMYLAVSGEKLPLELVLRTTSAPGAKFEAVPRGAMRFAGFMHRTGTIAEAPADWKDVFFPEAYDLPGS